MPRLSILWASIGSSVPIMRHIIWRISATDTGAVLSMKVFASARAVGSRSSGGTTWLTRRPLSASAAEVFATFGRVPMFFYLLHVPLIHGGSVAARYLLFGSVRADALPSTYVPSLLPVYGAWLLAVALLYPACRWYAGYKRRHRDNRWLSYLRIDIQRPAQPSLLAQRFDLRQPDTEQAMQRRAGRAFQQQLAAFQFLPSALNMHII
eukprot:gene37135-50096_t